jgi:AcrR family transcriptional regulator
VNAAVLAIDEFGVRGVVLEDVCSRASVGKGQLYHHFFDRDDLIRAAVRAKSRAVLSLQATMMGRLDDFTALRAWFDCLVQLQVDGDARGGCPLASLAAALVEHDELVRGDLVAAYDAWESMLRAGLVAMRERGDLRPDADTDALTTSTMAAVQGGLVLTQVRRDPGQLATALDAAFAYLRSFAAA